MTDRRDSAACRTARNERRKRVMSLGGERMIDQERGYERARIKMAESLGEVVRDTVVR